MIIDITHNEHGMYLRTTYEGCLYGQLYYDITEQEAREKFVLFVEKLHKQAEDIKRYWEAMIEIERVS